MSPRPHRGDFKILVPTGAREQGEDPDLVGYCVLVVVPEDDGGGMSPILCVTSNEGQCSGIGSCRFYNRI